MLDLSVVIITKNAEDNIADALESVKWADDVVVVDSGSTDATLDIARRYTSRVSTRDWEGYGAQKNHATGLAANDWVLSLDADERVSPELAAEIKTLMLSARAESPIACNTLIALLASILASPKRLFSALRRDRLTRLSATPRESPASR